MPKLPGVFRPFLITFLFFLFSILSYFPVTQSPLFSTTVLAATPDPKPCQNPIVPNQEILTDNWLADQDKKPPRELQLTVRRYGLPGSQVTVRVDPHVPVNFSQISALFAPENSNYLEGKFQDKEHKGANIVSLSPADFSKYHAAAEKTAPRAMLDPLKKKYVDYVNTNPTLAESADTFTDFNGNDAKTVNDLVAAFGQPQPPSAGGDQNIWESGWGRYWDKIPTAYSEFYQAYIIFRAQDRRVLIQEVLDGKRCPYKLDRIIDFVMPEFFRTTATSSQLNQVIVPIEAQSCHAQDTLLRANNPRCNNQAQVNNGILAKIVSTCLKAFTENPVSNALKKVIKISQNIFLVKPVLAADPPDCIRVLTKGKQGQDPYCALPADQLQEGESCTNQNDSFKLDKDNENVICTFIIHWEKEMRLSDPPFDHCTPPDIYGYVTCTLAIYFWPVFKIPLQTEIWNNTLYSDNKKNEPFTGSADFQRKGQPGVYSFFTPKAVFEDENDKKIRALQAVLDACQRDSADLGTLDRHNQSTWPPSCQDLVAFAGAANASEYPQYNQCVGNWPGPKPFDLYINCANDFFTHVIEGLKLKKPGKSTTEDSNESDLKRRFIGGTDCSKEFVWHNALYPLAAQKQYGITNACPVQVAGLPNTGSGPGTVPPGTGTPPNNNNCGGWYTLTTPIGNFGDPRCQLVGGSSRTLVAQSLAFIESSQEKIRQWLEIIQLESSFNANAYASVSTSGQAFGLFQAGHQQYSPAQWPPNGLPFQIGDLATEYDRGDVDWPLQISNAVNYSNTYANGSFCISGIPHWQAARDLGYC